MTSNATHAERETLPQSEYSLKHDSVAKLFRKFAIPGVVGLLFIGIQAVIDGAMVGNFVGANALASLSLTLPIYSFLYAMSIAISAGCQAVVSISLGENNRARAGDAIFTSLCSIVLGSAIFGVTVLLFAEDIMRLLGANDVLIVNSVSYIRTLFYFAPLLVLLPFCDYMLKSLSHPLYSMIITITTVALNISLNLYFIIVLESGVRGAALATGIAFAVGVLMALPIVLRDRSRVDVFKGRFSWSLLGRMIYNGSSEGIAELSAAITIVVFNLTMMSYMGEVGVAAFTALEYTLFVFITVFLGISNGVIPIISYNYGAKQGIRIKKTFIIAALTNLTIGVVLFLTLMFFGGHIVRLFFKGDEYLVLDIASRGIKIYAFAFLLNGFNILVSSYFTSIANAKISALISLMRGVVLVTPLILILPQIMGIEGVWYAIPIAEAITFVISFTLVRRSLRTISAR